MKKITLKKVTKDHVLSLQRGVQDLSDDLSGKINPQMSLLFFEHVLQLDILQRLFVMMRNKLESDSVRYSISLRPSEAVVLLYVCQDMQKNRLGEGSHGLINFSENTAEKYKNELDRQLKSL